MRAVVATGASGFFPVVDKLSAMGVFVAIIAHRGGGVEVNVAKADFQIWRLVTIDTGDRPVRADK